MLSIEQKHVLLLQYCKDGIVDDIQELLDENDDIDICYDNGTYFYFAFENAETDTTTLNLLLHYAKEHNVDYDKLSDILLDVEDRVGSISPCIQEIIDQFRSDIENEVVDYVYSIAAAYDENNIIYLKKHQQEFSSFIKEHDKFTLTEKASVAGHFEVIDLICELANNNYTKAAIYRCAALANKDFVAQKKYLLKSCQSIKGFCEGYRILGELCDQNGEALEAVKYFIQVDINNKQLNVYDKMYAKMHDIFAENVSNAQFISLAHKYKNTVRNESLKILLHEIDNVPNGTLTTSTNDTQRSVLYKSADDNISHTTLSIEALTNFSIQMQDETSASNVMLQTCDKRYALSQADRDFLFTISTQYQSDFDEILQQFSQVLEKQSIDVKDLLSLYAEDKRHLDYLMHDPYVLFLDQVTIADKDLCDFVIHNKYITRADVMNIRDTMDDVTQKAFDTRTNNEFANPIHNVDYDAQSYDLLKIFNHTKDSAPYKNSDITRWIDDITYNDTSNTLTPQGNNFFSEHLRFSDLARQDSLSDTISSIENTLPSEDTISCNDDELTKQTVQLKHKISSIEDAHGALEKSLNDNNQQNIVASYINLACICSIQGQFDFAILCYNKALEIVKKIYSKIPESPTVAIIYDNLGNSYMLKGALEKSLEYYDMALDIKQNIYQNQLNTIDIAKSYDNVANVYKFKQDFKGAIDYLTKSLQIKMILYEGDKNNDEIANIYADTYHDLGNMYSNSGAINLAISCYEASIEIKEHIYKKTKLRPDILLTQYLNLAYACKANGKLDKVESYYAKSTKIKESIEDDIGVRDPKIMISIYHNLGLMHHEEKNLAEAIEYYSKELHIKQQLYSKNLNHPTIAANYLILGNAYRDKGDLRKAIECYCQELDIKKKIYLQNPNHPDLILSYHNLGDSYGKAMMHNDAINCYQKALNIAQISCKNHPLLCNIHGNLAVTYAKINNYDKAVDCCQKALNIAQASYKKPQDNILLVSIYSNLGNICAAKGELQEAINYHNEVLKIKQKFNDIFPHSNIAHTYNILGNIYLEKEDVAQANNYYSKALQEAKKENGSSHILIVIYTSIGNMYAREDQDLQKALENYNKALKEAEIIYKDSPYHINLAKCYNNLGTIYRAKNEYSHSEKNYKKALEIAEKTNQHDSLYPNPNVALLCNNLGDLCNNTQKWGDAIEYLTKAYKIACYFHLPLTELIKQNLVKSANGFAVQKSVNPEYVLCILTECLNNNRDFLDHKIQSYMSDKLHNNSDITPSDIVQNISIIMSGQNETLKQEHENHGQNEMIELTGSVTA